MKECNKCLEHKPFSEFHKNKNTKDGTAYHCKSCVKTYVSNWQKENPDKTRRKSNTWRNKNRARLNNTQSLWRKNNSGHANFLSTQYQMKKQKRIPIWLTKEDLKEINEIYKLAEKLTKDTGISHEVDHIIPLNGKNISGLHCPQNLQILSKTDNRKKSNKID